MCKKVDCIYRMPVSATHGCNYMFVTGESKLGNMPKGEKYKVDTCPYYQCGVRVRATKESPLATPNNVRVRTGIRTLKAREADAIAMYESGMNDIDIAKAFGVSRITIASWRKKRFLTAQRKKSIDWESIEKALKNGDSIENIASAFDVEKVAVEIYAERRKLGGLEINDLHTGDEV